MYLWTAAVEAKVAKDDILLENESNSLDLGLVNGEDIRIIYIQPRILPKDTDKEIIDFSKIAEAIIKKFPDDEFMTRLSGSLGKWSND